MDVLANDSDSDGDALTVSSVGSAGHGSVVNNGSSVTYTPHANYHGSDTFSYTVSDGRGGTDTANVTITINPVNDAPTAVDDAGVTEAATAVDIDVLANDTDVDGDSLSVSDVTQGSHGAVEINANGTVKYTPEAGFAGLDSFTYTADDGNGGTDTATVTVVVSAPAGGVDAVDDIATTPEDTAVSIAVLANDTTITGTLAVISVSQPQHGTTVISGTTRIIYTPDANYNGTVSYADTFTYTASDGVQSADTATVTVVVDPVNDAPDARDDSVTLDEDTTADIQALTNDVDVDGDALSVSGLGQPGHGRVILRPDGSLRYTPTANYNGPDSFNYTIRDGQGGTDTAKVFITINPVNDAPDAVADAITTDEDVPVTIQVLANDSDEEGDALTITGVTQALNGTVTIEASGVISYTPNADYNGSDDFTYTISDGNGGTDTAAVAVTVNPVDDPPEGVRDATILETETALQTPNKFGTPTSNLQLLTLATEAEIDVLANDVNRDSAQLEVTRVGRARFGRVSIAQNGKVKYIPDADFTQGTDTFTYTVGTVGKVFESIDAVTIVLNPPGGEVIAVDDTVTTQEDHSVSFSIIDNDVNNAAGTQLSLMGVIPNEGLVVVNPDDTVTYYPAADLYGTDVFTYVVGNGELGADTGLVTVTIEPVNDFPDAVADGATTTEEISVTIDVLANDSDIDGDALSVVSVTQGRNGAVVINGDDTLTYTPNPRFYGIDRFSYVLRDAHGADDIGVVLVGVTPINNYPEAAIDLADTPEDTAIDIQVLINDFDADDDVLTITQVTQGSDGTVTINGASTVTYAPDTNFNGQDSFTYRVSDGQLSDTATVEVNIVSVNDAPAAVDDSVNTATDTPRDIFILANDTDAELDPLSVSAIGPAANGVVTLNDDGYRYAVTYTPDPGFTSTDTFTYTVTDGSLGSTATVSVTVGVPNNAPTGVDDSATTAEDTPVTIAVLVGDSDPDGDPLMVSAVSQADSGVVSTNGRTVVYRPSFNFNGTGTFTYTVSDGDLTAGATVVVDVTAVNDPPTAVDDQVVTEKNTALTFNALPNDADVDGDHVNVSAVGSAAHGTVTLQPNTPVPVRERKITYTPEQDFTGTDVFTYTITDGALTDTATVTARVITLHPTSWFVDFVGEQSTLGGQPLPMGAVVRAYDPSGVLAGRAEVTQSGWYLMPVYGDDPSTELDEGAEAGDTITLTVDDYPAVPLGPDPPVWTAAGERVHVELEVCPLFGDLDCDCDVDVADIMMVTSRWSCQLGDECYDPWCDLDDDDDIDIMDIMIVAIHWGEVCSP